MKQFVALLVVFAVAACAGKEAAVPAADTAPAMVADSIMARDTAAAQ